MSFKLKTTLLVLSISLLPYIFIMLYGGNILRNEYYDSSQKEMQTQLILTKDKIEQYLEAIARDMRFVSGLDVMNDIFSKDLDRRISNLLNQQKDELGLNGDFYVIDKNRIVIASSDALMLSKTIDKKLFYSFEIYSPFDKSQIATIELDFSLDNLTRFFSNTDERQYYLMLEDGSVFFKEKEFEEALTVRTNIDKRSNISIILEEDKDVFTELLRKYEQIFVFTFFLGALLISLIALYFSSRLIKPIIELSQVADEITKKQDYTYQVKVSSRDEIGRLSNSFNTMITGMANALRELKVESENRLKLTEEKSKNEMLEELSSKLSRYLSPQIYESIFSGDQDVTLTSKRKKLTVFFSDIVGFTDITDKMESEDLSELLNDYLNEMTLIALNHGATVDKYIGDAMMLFFGDPTTNGAKEDALSCVNMALEMQEEMVKLRNKWKNKGFSKPFQVRMGIHTGYCTVGNFGSENRLEYTIIGSSVNLASRIESSANPDEILISEETKLLVEDEFVCSERTQITPKGFMRPVILFDVKNKDSSSSDRYLLEEDGLFLQYELDKITPQSRKKIKEELTILIEKV